MKIENGGTLFSVDASKISKKEEKNSSFEILLLASVADLNMQLQQASDTQKALADGKVENIVEAMTTIEKADIALRFATEIRNKAVEAYQEILRMQV